MSLGPYNDPVQGRVSKGQIYARLIPRTLQVVHSGNHEKPFCGIHYESLPSSEGLKDRAARSPALFNHCVLNWFSDWSTDALYQVGYEFTNKVDLDKSDVSVYMYMKDFNFELDFKARGPFKGTKCPSCLPPIE